MQGTRDRGSLLEVRRSNLVLRHKGRGQGSTVRKCCKLGHPTELPAAKDLGEGVVKVCAKELG